MNKKPTSLNEPKEDLRQTITDALELRRQAIVYAIARKFHSCLKDRDVSIATSADDWITISSLSQLRALVGGRFQNLKERWLVAGLPLRAHRGDRTEEAELNHQGWIDLVNWVAKQGFEARLSGERKEGLFEVRKID